MCTRIAAVALAALHFAILTNSRIAAAQDAYPSRPVKIVLSLPAGSAPDIRLRIVAHRLTSSLGQQIVIENRPGAGGALAVQSVLSSPADGYTLLATVSSVFTVLPAQRNNLPFDVNRDLVPIASMSNEGMVLAVSSKLGVRNLAELVALAKAQPDKLIIGTNPAGSMPHLSGLLFTKLTGAPMTVIPYSRGGTNEAIREILGGRIHAVIEARNGLQAQIDSGDLKALAIMTRQRVATTPDLPTAMETVPGLVAVGFTGVFAAKETRDVVVRRLAASIREALDDPEVKSRLEQTGSPFQPLLADDFARFIENEQKLWWPIVKTSGLN